MQLDSQITQDVRAPSMAKEHRTVKAAGVVAKMPENIAIITRPEYQNALKCCRRDRAKENAYLLQITENSSLSFEDGMAYIFGQSAQEVEFINYSTNERIDEIDMPFLMAVYSVIYMNLSDVISDIASEEELKRKLMNYSVDIYIPAFLKFIGSSCKYSKNDIEMVCNKIMRFQNVVGVTETTLGNQTYADGYSKPANEARQTQIMFNAPLMFEVNLIDKGLIGERQSSFPMNSKIVQFQYDFNNCIQNVYIDYRYAAGLKSALDEIEKYRDDVAFEVKRKAVFNAYPVVATTYGCDDITPHANNVMADINNDRVMDYTYPKVLCGDTWKDLPSTYGISYSIHEADVWDFEEKRKNLLTKYIDVSNVNQQIANKETNLLSSLCYLQVILSQGEVVVLALTANQVSVFLAEYDALFLKYPMPKEPCHHYKERCW